METPKTFTIAWLVAAIFFVAGLIDTEAHHLVLYFMPQCKDPEMWCHVWSHAIGHIITALFGFIVGLLVIKLIQNTCPHREESD